MISIVVPIYNTASLLPRCIESIIAQNLSDWELLLVDDGSEDESGVICDNYSKIDTRIKTIHQENQGPSSARNSGIKHASGEWITFVDSDDYLDSNFLNGFNLDATDNLCLFLQGITIHDQNSSTVELPPQKCLGYNSAKLYSLDIIQKRHLLYNKCLKHAEDQDFVLRYCEFVSSFHYHNNYYYHYMKRSDSLSSREVFTDAINNNKIYHSFLSRDYVVQNREIKEYLVMCIFICNTTSLGKIYKGDLKNRKNLLIQLFDGENHAYYPHNYRIDKYIHQLIEKKSWSLANILLIIHFKYCR